MEKRKELEKRLEQLELLIDEWEREKFREKTRLSAFDLAFAHPNYREELLNKYSESNLPDECKHLDFKKAVDKMKGRNRDVKLRFWNDYRNQLWKALGWRMYDDHYWHELAAIVEKAIDFYADDVVRWILEKGEYVDSGGPRERRGEKEIAYQCYLDLKENQPSMFYQSGRQKGKAIKKQVEPILREKIGKSPFDSMRSVWDYIRERETKIH